MEAQELADGTRAFVVTQILGEAWPTSAISLGFPPEFTSSVSLAAVAAGDVADAAYIDVAGPGDELNEADRIETYGADAVYLTDEAGRVIGGTLACL